MTEFFYHTREGKKEEREDREEREGRGTCENSPLCVHEPKSVGGEGTTERRKSREEKWRKMGIEKEKRGRGRKGGEIHSSHFFRDHGCSRIFLFDR